MVTGGRAVETKKTSPRFKRAASNSARQQNKSTKSPRGQVALNKEGRGLFSGCPSYLGGGGYTGPEVGRSGRSDWASWYSDWLRLGLSRSHYSEWADGSRAEVSSLGEPGDYPSAPSAEMVVSRPATETPGDRVRKRRAGIHRPTLICGSASVINYSGCHENVLAELFRD